MLAKLWEDKLMKNTLVNWILTTVIPRNLSDCWAQAQAVRVKDTPLYLSANMLEKLTTKVDDQPNCYLLLYKSFPEMVFSDGKMH